MRWGISTAIALASMLAACTGEVSDGSGDPSRDGSAAPIDGASFDAGGPSSDGAPPPPPADGGSTGGDDAGAGTTDGGGATPVDAGTTPEPTDWISYVSFWRSVAHLPPVTERATLSAACELHARYMVENDVIQHSEDPSNPFYSAEGDAAARASNLWGDFSNHTFVEAIDEWMSAPFHAIGVIDARLREVGFGDHFDASSPSLKYGVALDVIRGIGGSTPPGVTYPLPFPGDGSVVPLTRYLREVPDPLSACPGYSAPAGLPILLQLGPGFSVVPNVTSTSFRGAAGALEHCVFDETDYTYPDAAWQSTARQILDGRDAVVLIPRAPLAAGETYEVSITANGTTTTWSFSVSSTPHR